MKPAQSYLVERHPAAPHPTVRIMPWDPDALRLIVDLALTRGSALMIWWPDRGPCRVLGWQNASRLAVMVRQGEAPLEPLALALACSWAGERSTQAA